MGIFQYAIMAWFMVILLIASNQHGKQLHGRVNFWVTLAIVAVNVAALAFGGFFTNA